MIIIALFRKLHFFIGFTIVFRGMCVCASVCEGVCGCVWVCVWVGVGVCGCECAEFQSSRINYCTTIGNTFSSYFSHKYTYRVHTWKNENEKESHYSCSVKSILFCLVALSLDFLCFALYLDFLCFALPLFFLYLDHLIFQWPSISHNIEQITVDSALNGPLKVSLFLSLCLCLIMCACDGIHSFLFWLFFRGQRKWVEGELLHC